MNDNFQRIKLIVGLGNPGVEYACTRHNAGFMFLDKLHEKLPRSFEQRHIHESHLWKGTYAGWPLVLQKPDTFMNLSGNAVAPLMRSMEITENELLVVHDDMDIPLGHLRIRRGGGSAGHNGIKSIVENLGTENFFRLRIGVGHPNEGKDGIVDYVLSDFSKEDEEIFERTLSGAVEAVILMMRRGPSQAMCMYNGKSWCNEPEQKQIQLKDKENINQSEVQP